MAKRGRPIGSGIDDSTMLQELAKLIREDPSLRPTTAIKMLGIVHPSVIRRIRDKHRLGHGERKRDGEALGQGGVVGAPVHTDDPARSVA